MAFTGNIAAQNAGILLWNGPEASSTPAAVPRQMDIRNWNAFAFSFEVVVTLVADAVFNIEYAEPSDADPCVPDTWLPVPEIATCQGGAEPGPQATVTLPAATEAGTICGGTIPCRNGAFLRVVPASGDTGDVIVVGLLQGPRV